MCQSKTFWIWFFQILALLGLISFILWLILRPKYPTCTIVDFSVPAATQGTISYNLKIENPNLDWGIYYDDIILTFYYGQDTAGEKTIPSFYQGKRKKRHVNDQVDTIPHVWKALFNAISNATAELRVGFVTKIRYKMWGGKSKPRGIYLEGHLRVGSDGKISGKKKKVKLHHASVKSRTRTRTRTRHT